MTKAKAARASKGAGGGAGGPAGKVRSEVSLEGRFGLSKATAKASPDYSARQEAKMHEGLEQMIGRRLSREDISSIAGAPDNATVHFETTTFGGQKAFDIFVRGTEAGKPYNAHRIVHLDKRGRLVMHNQIFESEAGKTGLGLRVLGRQIENLKRLGFDRIDTQAARGSGLAGYAIWPKFGYNAVLSKQERSQIREAGVGNPRTVQELYRTQAGREWWEKHGGTTHMRLSLRKNSQSLRVFDAYAKQKGF